MISIRHFLLTGAIFIFLGVGLSAQAITTSYSIEAIPPATIEIGAAKGLVSELYLITNVIFWITLLAVLFYLIAVISPSIGQRVFGRPWSRLLSFHLAIQTALLGLAIWIGFTWALSRFSCGGFEGSCPSSYFGQYLAGAAIMLVGLPGLIGTWRRSRWLIYWNWLPVVAAALWFLMFATSDFLLSLSLLPPLAIIFGVALTTKRLLRTQILHLESKEERIVDNRPKT